MLRMEVPTQWQAGGGYSMNQKTFARLTTMSDTSGRRLLGMLLGFFFVGVPATSSPKCLIVYPVQTDRYGDWQNAYTPVTRRH